MQQLKNKLILGYRLVTKPYRLAFQCRARRGSSFPIPILFYHRVADRHPTDWTISNAGFQAQMEWLAAHFELISLEEAQRRIEQKQNSNPACAITFDDGYAENHDSAIPYLLKNQIPFTYFVAVNHVVNDLVFPHDQALGLDLPRDSVESLQALSTCGVDIGCHTRSHIDFSETHSDEVVFEEVVDSTRQLQALVKRAIRYFAIPFGQTSQMDQRVFELARRIGIRGVCSAFGGLNSVQGNSFHLQRIHGDPSLERLKNWLTWDPRMVGRTDPIDEMVQEVLATTEIESKEMKSLEQNASEANADECQTIS